MQSFFHTFVICQQNTISPFLDKPGRCPKPRNGVQEVCVYTLDPNDPRPLREDKCQRDNDCADDQKCCYNGCDNDCVPKDPNEKYGTVFHFHYIQDFTSLQHFLSVGHVLS